MQICEIGFYIVYELMYTKITEQRSQVYKKKHFQLYYMVVYHDIIYANFQFSDPVRNGAPVNETVLL